MAATFGGSTCRSAARVVRIGWLAQDERIYDNFYLKRIKPTEARGLSDDGRWPDDLITYERVLSLGRTLAKPWSFLDPQDPALVSTAADLMKERPGITVEDIAYLLSIEPEAAARLLPS